MESTAGPGNGGFLCLRNKLDEAAHTRTTSQLNHEKNEIHRNIEDLKSETKDLKRQILAGNGELGRLKARQETLRNRLESDREELATVEKHLGMFSSMSAGTVVDSQKTCVAKHRHGMDMLEKEFGYHPLFRRPGDTFMATSTFVPRVKFS